MLLDLAIQVVRDGEGAQKLVRIDVTGAVDDASAKRIGMAVANSPLVKTAIAGEDANWGRIVMAVGKAGEPADRDRLSVGVGGTWMAREGTVVPGYDEAPVVAHMKGREIDIAVDIGLGHGPLHGLDLRPDPRLYRHQRVVSQLARPAPGQASQRAAALTALSERAFQKAMSASLLNITRTPLPPWLTRIFPPLRALWSASQATNSGSSFPRPSNSRTPAISSTL